MKLEAVVEAILYFLSDKFGTKGSFYNYGIVVIPISGGTPVTLAQNYGQYYTWSADSTKIIFDDYLDHCLSELNADGSSSSPTTLLSEQGDFTYMAASSDGTKLAAIYAYNGPASLYVINSDGTNPTPLTPAVNTDSVQWSPDGSKIAFGNLVSGYEVLFVINANGTGLVQISPSGYTSWYPHWSPDSSQLVYEGGTTNSIYTVNADGTGTNLVYTPTGGAYANAETDWVANH